MSRNFIFTAQKAAYTASIRVNQPKNNWKQYIQTVHAPIQSKKGLELYLIYKEEMWSVLKTMILES